MKTRDVQLKGTFFNCRLLPEDGLPVILIWGRSNVGKSSLINKLLNRKNLSVKCHFEDSGQSCIFTKRCSKEVESRKMKVESKSINRKDSHIKTQKDCFSSFAGSQ